uniref:cyclin-dependent kinase inhibitor 1-like n=1 Tax=Myxine glutinosa TaxID=7769 RepID=UPI00358F5FB9
MYTPSTGSPGDTTKAPVRRCLFGSLKDDASFSLECSNELRASTNEASCRWGFDFVQDVPLSDGRERSFIWEVVSSHEVPPFYRELAPEDPRMRIQCPAKREHSQRVSQTDRIPNMSHKRTAESPNKGGDSLGRGSENAEARQQASTSRERRMYPCSKLR